MRPVEVRGDGEAVGVVAGGEFGGDVVDVEAFRSV